MRNIKPTYHIETWGCQMNEDDSEQLALYMESMGYIRADTIMDADAVLLNTCSVRQKPEDKAFSLLGILAIAKHENPDLIIGVCGCMTQIRAKEIKRRAPFVDFILGTGNIAELPNLLARLKDSRQSVEYLSLPERKGAIATDIPQRITDRTPQLKTFVPIQYGCDKFCTFCIVPTTRGRERSRPAQDIVDEVKKCADKGVKEITLLGQTVNSYGKHLREGRVPFAKLLEMVSSVEGIERIRFTSPYPNDFTDDLIDQLANNPKVMEHVHLPLQSGDNEILKRMHRMYTLEAFAEIYKKLRERVPGISITTDLIVGFPGETESQFQNTLTAVQQFRFDSAFMFAYSARPGTVAAEFDNQVDKTVKKERLNNLIVLQNSIALAINQAQVGQTFEVLVEGPSEKNTKLLTGTTRHFKTVVFAGEAIAPGTITTVKTQSGHLWGFRAILNKEPDEGTN